MAAQYTEVTLEDMEKFLKRGFRALRPKQGVQNSEYYYELYLSPNVSIRVWTSVQRGTGSGAGVGEDAIRVQLMGVHTKRPLMQGKAPIVKRTQGWRNTLQNKIEDMIEAYEEKQDYWESRSGAPQEAPASSPPEAQAPSPTAPTPPPAPARPPSGGPPPSDKQIKYVKFLMSRVRADDLEAEGLFTKHRNLEWPFSEDNIRRMTLRQVSTLIDDLKSAGGGRYANDVGADEESYDYNFGVT